MTSQKDIVEKFWDALEDDRTVFLSVPGAKGGEPQPMTAILEDDEQGPLYIFSSMDVDLVQAIGVVTPAELQFASKGHHLFATAKGHIQRLDDRAVIDRLWNPFVAAWYEGGKDDPKLVLLRLDLTEAHVWLNENSLFAGVKMLLGSDPKEDYKDKKADVSFRVA